MEGILTPETLREGGRGRGAHRTQGLLWCIQPQPCDNPLTMISYVQGHQGYPLSIPKGLIHAVLAARQWHG